MRILTVIFTLLFPLMCIQANNEPTKALRGGKPVHTGTPATFLGNETFRDIERQTSNLEVFGQKEQAPVVMRAGDGTTIFGEMVFSSLWHTDEDAVFDWGVYSFPAQANTTLTQHHLHTTIQANGGGAYHNGKLYFTSYYEGYESLWYLYFCTLDLNTWEMEKIALPNDIYSSIALDMTFDPVGKHL